MAISLAVYINTFDIGNIVWWAALLTIAGMVLTYYFTHIGHKPPEYYDAELTKSEKGSIWEGTLYALVLIGMAGIVSNKMLGQNIFLAIPGFAIPTTVTELSLGDQATFSVLMAIAEEQFFRSALTNALIEYGPGGNFVGILGSGFIGAVFHWARYGAHLPIMMFVWMSFSVISWVAVKYQRVSPCMLAHAIHNWIVVMGPSLW